MIDMTLTVERDFARGLIVVRLTGALRLGTRRRAVDAVARCLAEAPSAVIVDVTGLALAGPAARAVIVRLQRMAGQEPAVTLLWCAAPGPVADRLAGLGRDMRVYRGLDTAADAAVGGPDAAQWVYGRFPRTIEAASSARLLVGDACLRWGRGDVLHDARLVVSELVSNAIDHGRGEITVTACARTPYVVTTVRDESPQPPRKTSSRVVPGAAAPTLPDRGFGLHLVEGRAAAWGYVLTDGGGKAVWAALRTDAVRSPAESSARLAPGSRPVPVPAARRRAPWWPPRRRAA